MSRAKRRFDEDPLASDPEDEDYGKPSPRKKITKPVSGSNRRPLKRQRRNVDSDDDDIEDDSDDIEDDDNSASAESDSADDDSNADVNSRTGRRKRKAASKAVKYEEPSTDENDSIEEVDEANDDDDSDDIHAERHNRMMRKQPSLIVKLPINPNLSSSTRRTSHVGGKGPKHAAKLESAGTRRSRRLSHDDQEDMLELTASGRNAQVARSGTRSPEPLQKRPTRGGKGLGKPSTSTIIEASQEDSGHSRAEHQESFAEVVESTTANSPANISAFDAEQVKREQFAEGEVIEESVHGEVEDGDDDDDDPVATRRRPVRAAPDEVSQPVARSSQRSRRRGVEESSDFEPEAGGEDPAEDIMSSSGESKSPKKSGRRNGSETSSGDRRSRRIANKKGSSQRSGAASEEDSDINAEELAEEVAELATASRRRKSRSQLIRYDAAPRLRSRGNKPDYRIFRPELAAPIEDDEPVQPSSSYRGRRTGGAHRSLFSTLGPFGGAGGPLPIFGGPTNAGAAGGADSDSSDDDVIQKTPRPLGGTVGMTPTSLAPHGLLPQGLNPDPAQGTSGAPANFGKVKDRKALADADPLGVDPSVSFEGVGGLDGHINQLKEMVSLPLLYPEVFQRFHVTPPRGVLFHGPPGTGKTLLARALAASVSAEGRKVTFYMRKGADALSKWVGEAERQLRLLFEEARKNQPSIIFFDEIDGLAPVRSSKQEQIHASIVATLLALMDGMDGRGQVIVIGATNRPDSVDPALRRPGRFDREFYFPLPNKEARRAILEIHTKGWDPPLKPEFISQLSELTKGYGGADLRALCTEAALNAVQGTYPQIYKSNQKLLIDPSQIKVLAKDFMISVDKMIPSSERSGATGAASLEKSVEPLLRHAIAEVTKLLDDAMPARRKLTALEEAEFDDRDDNLGFDREILQQNFDRRRIYRPRLLIRGLQGMGQQYLGAALLNKFERLHVQSFDLSTIFGDATKSPEAAVVQLFNEVRRHKPSVIYIPNANNWYDTVGRAVTKLFAGLLRSLPPNDPVLVLGIMESSGEKEQPDPEMLREIFGFSPKNQFFLKRINMDARREYFATIISYVAMAPTDFPESETRKKRTLAQLPIAPAPPSPDEPSKIDLKAQRKQDRQTLNLLKMYIQPIMDQLRNKYKKFRAPIVDEARIRYLFDELSPQLVSTDLAPDEAGERQFRPYELAKDEKDVDGLLEVESGKFYYNLELVTIEKRLSNGYYKRPKDFLGDIKRLAKDARTSGDAERTLKANEMLTNVEVDMQLIFDVNNAALVAACEQVHNREQERAQLYKEKEREIAAKDQVVPLIIPNVPPKAANSSTGQSSGPIVLGEPIPGPATFPPYTPVRASETSQLTNGYSPPVQHPTGELDIKASDLPASDNDVHMSNGEDVPASQPEEQKSTGIAQPTHTQRSQKSAFTPLAQDSQPADYHNSASTTTNGQKTSDKSNRSSGPYVDSQSTNGVHSGERPNFSERQPLPGGSQLPDTQEMTYPSSPSQQMSPPSQPAQPPMPPPTLRHPPSIQSLLNKPEDSQLKLDQNALQKLHEELADRSSGCTVEQLEQINATLMDAVWLTRHEWDRVVVMNEVAIAFNRIIGEIAEAQGIDAPSQEKLVPSM